MIICLNLMISTQFNTHRDYANYFYENHKLIFKCTSFKDNIWYHFKNQKWRHDIEGNSLKKRIEKDCIKKHLTDIDNLKKVIELETDQNNVKEYEKMIANFCRSIQKLKLHQFKNGIMAECREIFYDDTFENKLDTNIHLIGFNNGVYDLNTKQLRNTEPDDYIRLSTCIDYIEFTGLEPVFEEILIFFEQLFPNQHQFALLFLSSFLEGNKMECLFNIWFGVNGPSGKSTLLCLLKKSFGEYCERIPVDFLNQKISSVNFNHEKNLKGVRLCIAEEFGNFRQLELENIKSWINNYPINRKILYHFEPKKFNPQFKIIYCCAENMPIISDRTHLNSFSEIKVTSFNSRFVDYPNSNWGTPRSKDAFQIGCTETPLFQTVFPKGVTLNRSKDSDVDLIPPDSNLNPWIYSHEYKRDRHLHEKLDNWKQPFMYMIFQYHQLYMSNGLSIAKNINEQYSD